ncbi:MAG: hypothetical protein IJ901_01735 [Bacteroidaceae bacterium]|nr:hypothetical protein [Bacteroidaceae bacterium]
MQADWLVFSPVFCLGFLHLAGKRWTALKGTEADAGCGAAGIYVALPVSTHDDTTASSSPSHG